MMWMMGIIPLMTCVALPLWAVLVVHNAESERHDLMARLSKNYSVIDFRALDDEAIQAYKESL